MKFVLVNGSPRRDGNTARLLGEVQRVLAGREVQSRLVHTHESLKGLELPYCRHCAPVCAGVCYRGTETEDDIMALGDADGIVIGSPVYFGTVSAPLKAFWDLTRVLRSSRRLLYTVGGALSVGAGRFGGQETTIRAIHDMMLVQGMIVVGDSSQSSAGHFGAPTKSPAEDDEHGLARARELADAVADVALATGHLR